MAHFNDELDDVTPATPSATPTTTTTNPVAVAAKFHEEDETVDLEGDHESLKAQASLPNALPKEANKFNRFALIKGTKAYQKATHFIAGAGSGKGLTVICPGADCPECAKGSDHQSRRKIAALVVLYTTDNNGKFPAGTTKPSVSIAFVNMSPTLYTELSDCPSEGEGIYDLDYKVVKKAGNGIGWTINRMSSPPSYLKAKMEEEVAELAAPYADGKVLKSRLGKVVSLAELKIILRGGSDLIDNAPTLDDLEAL